MTAKAHRCPASQTAPEAAILRSHETTAPITPGSAAAAFPARAFSQTARVFRCFLTQSLTPPWSEGVGGAGVGVTPPPPVPRTALLMASTMVDTMKPNAVRTDVIVTPCSRNRVRRRSASVVSIRSERSTRSIVSRMRENCVRRASQFAAAASRRDYRSSRSRLSSSCMCRFFSGLLAASSPSSSCSACAMSSLS